MLLASDAIARYQTATGAVADSATGLLRLTTAQFANLQSLFFTTNGVRDLVMNIMTKPTKLTSMHR